MARGAGPPNSRGHSTMTSIGHGSDVNECSSPSSSLDCCVPARGGQPVEVMLRLVCDRLLCCDRYKRGMVTVSSFHEVLQKLDLAWGSPEVDMIMRYCLVTEDGFVHYKTLMLEFGRTRGVGILSGGDSSYRRPKDSLHCRDNVAEALYPKEEVFEDDLAKRDDYQGQMTKIARSGIGATEAIAMTAASSVPHPAVSKRLLGWTPEMTARMQRLYRRWDRCGLRDHQFIEALEELGVEVSVELRRALATFGPSRTLSFAQFMQTLHLTDFYSPSRRSRDAHPDIRDLPDSETYPPCNSTCLRHFDSSSSSHRQNEPHVQGRAHTSALQFHPVPRNPITWEEPGERQQAESFLAANNAPFLDVSCVSAVATQNDSSRTTYGSCPHSSQVDITQGSSPAAANVVSNEPSQDTAETRLTKLRFVTSQFVDGLISGYLYRLHLDRCGVSISAVMDSLIRSHEGDNCGKFRDFWMALSRSIPKAPVDGADQLVSASSTCKRNTSRPQTSGVTCTSATDPTDMQAAGQMLKKPNGIPECHRSCASPNSSLPAVAAAQTEKKTEMPAVDSAPVVTFGARLVRTDECKGRRRVIVPPSTAHQSVASMISMQGTANQPDTATAGMLSAAGARTATKSGAERLQELMERGPPTVWGHGETTETQNSITGRKGRGLVNGAIGGHQGMPSCPFGLDGQNTLDQPSQPLHHTGPRGTAIRNSTVLRLRQ
eukprot:GHVT01081166.1.p1 GENE.GHVT01081166.1~~GHVT01081166.1.p1  ORF type:complete len:716 (+),score=74.52 GHVT01081166.1:1726-3873(+)